MNGLLNRPLNLILGLKEARDGGLSSSEGLKSVILGDLIDPKGTGLGLIFMKRDIEKKIDRLPVPEAEPPKPKGKAAAERAASKRST